MESAKQTSCRVGITEKNTVASGRGDPSGTVTLKETSVQTCGRERSRQRGSSRCKYLVLEKEADNEIQEIAQGQFGNLPSLLRTLAFTAIKI